MLLGPFKLPTEAAAGRVVGPGFPPVGGSMPGCLGVMPKRSQTEKGFRMKM